MNTDANIGHGVTKQPTSDHPLSAASLKQQNSLSTNKRVESLKFWTDVVPNALTFKGFAWLVFAPFYDGGSDLF